ncbi:hypothetical protein GY45DRAFT_1321207 [Cubamyces sp. BRFM 1775]|nr:hypothetical protein GY45DRAFT_1321207 [Cubamyces sp. BRFM 1775]
MLTVYAAYDLLSLHLHIRPHALSPPPTPARAVSLLFFSLFLPPSSFLRVVCFDAQKTKKKHVVHIE